MEADWEFDICGDAPVIEAHWPGFVSLRKEPWRVDEIAETRMLPGLTAALLRLNEAGSPVWTCKTDVFVPDAIDPDELAATNDEAKVVIACYIDILPRSEQGWNLPSNAEQDCRKLCARLREVSLHCCRIDMVIRRARIGSRSADGNELGATVYLTACGRTSTEAAERLAGCLRTFVRLIAS